MTVWTVAGAILLAPVLSGCTWLQQPYAMSPEQAVAYRATQTCHALAQTMPSPPAQRGQIQMAYWGACESDPEATMQQMRAAAANQPQQVEVSGSVEVY